MGVRSWTEHPRGVFRCVESRVPGFWWLSLSDSLVLAHSFQRPRSIKKTTPPAAWPTPSDKIWFVMAPGGKSKTSTYFDVKPDAGESATLKVMLGAGSDIPVAGHCICRRRGMGSCSMGPTSGRRTNHLLKPTQTIDFDARQSMEKSLGGHSREEPRRDSTSPVSHSKPPTHPEVEMVAGHGGARQRAWAGRAGVEIGAINASVDEQTTMINGVNENTGKCRVRPKGNLSCNRRIGRGRCRRQMEMSSLYADDLRHLPVHASGSICPEGDYTVSTTLTNPDKANW